MGVVKRNRDGVDAFEHAMQGVHTSNDHEIVSETRERGLIGTSSASETAGAADDTPSEREVIVKMRGRPPRRRR